jgi:hypothetical protein
MSYQSEKVKKWRKETKKRIVKAMGGECICCGYNKCNRALKLHHLDPEKKEFSLSKVMADPCSWTKIVSELRKCILVCGNCHEEIHDGITIIPKNCGKFDESFVTYKSALPQTYCPICGNKKKYTSKTCSRSCASRLNVRVDWDNIDLVGMIEKYHSWSEIGRQLDITDSSVIKRAKKLGLVK